MRPPWLSWGGFSGSYHGGTDRQTPCPDGCCLETCYLRSWALISRMLCEVLVHPPALDSIAKHRWAELSPNRPVLPKSQRFSSPSCDLVRLRCRAALLQPFPSPLDGKHVKALLLRSWPESGPVCSAKEWAGDIISFFIIIYFLFFYFLFFAGGRLHQQPPAVGPVRSFTFPAPLYNINTGECTNCGAVYNCAGAPPSTERG